MRREAADEDPAAQGKGRGKGNQKGQKQKVSKESKDSLIGKKAPLEQLNLDN